MVISRRLAPVSAEALDLDAYATSSGDPDEDSGRFGRMMTLPHSGRAWPPGEFDRSYLLVSGVAGEKIDLDQIDGR